MPRRWRTLFQRNGIAAASIDGTMDTAQRRELLQDLGTGKLKVLTSCALIGEGVDVPSVGGCILLRPTASVALHLQMIGRCLRPQPGKRAVVLDHVGNTLRLGHHLEPRDWTLDGVARATASKHPASRSARSASPLAPAPCRYAANAGMCLHRRNAASCSRLMGSWLNTPPLSLATLFCISQQEPGGFLAHYIQGNLTIKKNNVIFLKEKITH
jgi:superfamily II DNA or RNA helicase